MRRCARYVASLAPSVRLARRFCVHLSRFGRAGDYRALDRPEAFDEVYARGLRPLLESAERCRVFNPRYLGSPEPRHLPAWERYGSPAERARWLADYLRRARGAAEVDLERPGILDDVRFWWWLVCGRSTARVVIILPAGALDLPEYWSRTIDPVFVKNSVESVRRAALPFAKRETEDGWRMGFIVEQVGADVQLTVVACQRDIVPLFEDAVAHARLTDGFWWAIAQEEGLSP